MAIVVIAGGQANAAGGGDIALSAIDWANITVTNTAGKSLKFPFATNQPVEVPAK